MHHCFHTKMDAKNTERFNPMKGTLQIHNNDNLPIQNQAISPFRIFMERFTRRCRTKNFLQIDRAGFEMWKMMSKEEKKPYFLHARILDKNLLQASKWEAKSIIKVSDGADSAMVGKFDKRKVTYVGSSNSKYGVARKPFSKYI